MNMRTVWVGEHQALVEYDFFQMLLSEFCEYMTREEVKQFLEDSWVEEQI